MSEQNKAVVRRFLEALNAGDLTLIDDEVASDFVWHGNSFGEVHGREAFKQLAAPIVDAFPDLNVEVHDLIAEGDVVVARFTVHGTHLGDFFGVPATGREVAWAGHPIYRVADGKIVEEWYVEDIFGLMRQLGAVPGPPGEA